MRGGEAGEGRGGETVRIVEAQNVVVVAVVVVVMMVMAVLDHQVALGACD